MKQYPQPPVVGSFEHPTVLGSLDHPTVLGSLQNGLNDIRHQKVKIAVVRAADRSQVGEGGNTNLGWVKVTLFPSFPSFYPYLAPFLKF